MLEKFTKHFKYLALIFGVILGIKPIHDPDVDWHLAAGRWMLENKSWIHFDPFSWTFKNQPWMSIPWLHELTSWFLYLKFGDTGLVLFFSVISGLITYLLYKDLENVNNTLIQKISILTGVFSIGFIASTRWTTRPEIWTHLFGLIFVIILSDALREKNRTKLLLLIPIQALWANTHGIFIMGPILTTLALGCAIMESQFQKKPLNWKTWFATWAGVALINLLNPRGIEGAIFPFHLLNVLTSPIFSRSIMEAKPTFSGLVFDLPAQITMGLLLIFVFLIIIGIKRKKRIDSETLFTLGVFAITSYTAIAAVRNIPLLAIWCFPLIARIAKPLTGKITLTIILIFLYPIAFDTIKANTFYLQNSKDFRFWPAMAEDVAKFIEKSGLKGHGFTTGTEANYLIRRLYGNFEPFIDSRFAEVYSENHFKKYMDSLASPPILNEIADELNFDYVIVGHHLRIATPLAIHLAQNPKKWQLVHIDPIVAVWIRRGSKQNISWADKAELALKEKLLNWKSKQVPFPGSDDAAKLNGMGRIFSIISESELSIEAFEKSNLLVNRNIVATSGLCNVKSISCEPTDTNCLNQALSICDRALRLYPNQEMSNLASGSLLRNLGRFEEAVIHFKRCVNLNPASFEAHLQLGETLLKLGIHSKFFNESKTHLQLASQLRPNHPRPIFMIAQAYDLYGNKKLAIEFYQKSMQFDPPAEYLNVIIERLNHLTD
jgi:tetratricopeptide (TPR) repeat protein